MWKNIDKYIDKYINVRRVEIILFLWIYILSNIIPLPIVKAKESIIYPLKEISKLECRYQKFSELSANCKQELPVLNTKDYKKYATQNWWYNDYTRIYTVLWWASYKYGWDVWNGWHIWVDIATAEWTPVYAMADWEVVTAAKILWLWNAVIIKHKINWKYIYSNYWHLSKIDVTKWQKVSVWKKIWEVWSTWNSTWNHLHFQIDLDTSFHPYYYDVKSCPYTYNEISETWVCFSELEKNTLDPLLFLETNWWVLDKIVIKTEKIEITNNSVEVDKYSQYDLSIFNRTVYEWYQVNDIKKVQEVFSDLWEYKWPISWDYNDIKDDIISYQISNNIIKNENEEWAWYFWPKTRAQAKNDYKNFLSNWWQVWSWVNNVVVSNDVKIEKISKTWLLSREEIAKKELETFIKKYNIELKSRSIWDNIAVWETKVYDLIITDKSGKPFKWNMPSWVTFVWDYWKIKVFPEKFYYFTDWKREIKVTWIKNWDTTLYIKIWEEVFKTIPLKIYSWWWVNEPSDSSIISSNNIVIWDTQKWIIAFKDDLWKTLINVNYKWNFLLKANSDVEVCVKYWDIKDISWIYKKDCEDSWFENEVAFNYSKTVWWLVLFEYKVKWKNPKIELVNSKNSIVMSSKKLLVSEPKWIKSDYAYKNEIVDMLSNWIVDWINKWYFLEERNISKYDAVSWMENTLKSLSEDAIDLKTKNQIETNIKILDNYNASKYDYISRQQFLDMAYNFLVFNDDVWITISYKDLDDNYNYKANSIFDKENTWKDKFWNNYFRPDINITRWEAAYFLSKVIDKNNKKFLTSK